MKSDGHQRANACQQALRDAACHLDDIAERVVDSAEQHAARLWQLAAYVRVSELRVRRITGHTSYAVPRPHRHDIFVSGGIAWDDTVLRPVAGVLADRVAIVCDILRTASPTNLSNLVGLLRATASAGTAIEMRRRSEDTVYVLVGSASIHAVLGECLAILDAVRTLNPPSDSSENGTATHRAWVRPQAVDENSARWPVRRALRSWTRASFVTGTAAGFGTPVVARAAASSLGRRMTYAPLAAMLIGGFVFRRPVARTSVAAGRWAALYLTTRFPLFADLVTRHTLSWWRGFALGWNTASVVFFLGGWSRWWGGAPVLVTRVPRSVAELNRSLLAVGMVFHRLDDSALVRSKEPVPAPMESLTLPRLVQYGDDIMAHLHGKPGTKDEMLSSIRVIHTQPGGRPVLVVVLPGTQTFALSPVRNPYSMTQNLHLMAYGSASNSRAVTEVLLRERQRLGVTGRLQVVFYGHSQGGLLAVQLSRNAALYNDFHISHVVTTGSPIAGGEFPAQTQYLAVEHLEDVIAKTDLTETPRQPNVVTVTTAVVPRGELREVLAVHRWLEYRKTMQAVTTSDHPVLRRIVADITALLGPVQRAVDYPQERLLP